MRKLRQIVIALGCAVAACVPALAQSQQGVTKDQIIIGTIQDLSGPVARFGKQMRQGMQMSVDDINERGGIHGRKLVLKVEDSGYDPKRAVLAAQKLVDQDHIFAMVGHIGSAQNIATFPVLFEKNVINLFPASASREMYEPLHRLKYASSATYYDQMRVAAPRLVKEKGAQKLCAIYQDDEYGLEVLRGAETGFKAGGMALAEKVSYKRGATDFSSQVAKTKAAGCDFVVLGTLLRETIAVITEAHKIDFSPTFLMSGGGYTDEIHKLGGKPMDGLYTIMTAANPYMDDDSEPVRAWANKYKAKFNEPPSVHSVYGYMAAEAFIKGAQKAGANLTTDSFIQAMDSMTIPPDIFGSPEISFSPTKHLGNDKSRLSQIQNGRWKVVSGYLQ